jgi:hypothetical protein
VFKDMAQIAAVDPVIARRAPDEMLGLVLGRLTDQPADVGSAMMCYLGDGAGRDGGCMDANRFFVWIVFPLMFWAAMISSFLPPNTQVLKMLASLLP